MAASSDVHIRELTNRITLRVRGLRSFGLRVRIAMLLFRLAANIAGVGIVFEDGKADV